MERNKTYWITQIQNKTLDAVRERKVEDPKEKERREVGALRVVKSAGEIGGLSAEEIKRAIQAGAECATRRRVISDPKRK